jgi:hypothetical protein
MIATLYCSDEIMKIFNIPYNAIHRALEDKVWNRLAGPRGRFYKLSEIFDFENCTAFVSEKEFNLKYKDDFNFKRVSIKGFYYYEREWVAYIIYDRKNIGESYKEKVDLILDNKIKPLTLQEINSTHSAVYLKKFPNGKIYIGKTSQYLNERFNKAKWQAFNMTSGINPHDETLWNYPKHYYDYDVFVLYKGENNWSEESKAINENFHRSELLNVQSC